MEAGLSGGASDQSLMCEITVEIVCNLKNDLSVEGPYLNLNGGKSPVNKFETFFFSKKIWAEDVCSKARWKVLLRDATTDRTGLVFLSSIYI